MKKTTLLILLFYWAISALGQTIYFEEDFENGLPTSWQAETGWLHGEASTLSSSYFIIPSHSKFMAMNDDIAGETGISSGSIISPEIDLTTITGSVLLNFEAFFLNLDYYGNESAKVLISLDDMVSWTEIYDLAGNDIWQEHVVNLSEYVGETIHLAFAYDDGMGWSFGMCIDNVRIQSAGKFYSEAFSSSSVPYSIITKKQGAQLQLYQQVVNLGSEPLDSVRIRYQQRENNVFKFIRSTFVSVPSQSSVTDTFNLDASLSVDYQVKITISHDSLDAALYDDQYNVIVNDSVIAYDDGIPSNGLSYYYSLQPSDGYFGMPYELKSLDTLTAIHVFIHELSLIGASFSVQVIPFELDSPSNNYLINLDNQFVKTEDLNTWKSVVLPDPLIMEPGKYLITTGYTSDFLYPFAIGYDADPNLSDGYWTNPNLGTGWFHFPGNIAYIRTVFGAVDDFSSTAKPSHANPKIKLSPNPVIDQLSIKFDHKGDYKISIYSLSGHLIKRINSSLQDEVLISTSSWPIASYIIEIDQNGQRYFEKFIKQ